MAKNMAVIENGVVVNMEWVDVNQDQTETLIDLGDRPVAVGDSYDGYHFYRDGVKLLTPLEKTQAELTELKETSSAIQADTDAMLVDYEYRLTMMELGLTE